MRAAVQRCLAPRSLFFARALWSGTFEEQADSPSGHAYIGDALLCALAWRQIDPAGSRAEHARIDRMVRAGATVRRERDGVVRDVSVGHVSSGRRELRRGAGHG